MSTQVVLPLPLSDANRLSLDQLKGYLRTNDSGQAPMVRDLSEELLEPFLGEQYHKQYLENLAAPVLHRMEAVFPEIAAVMHALGENKLALHIEDAVGFIGHRPTVDRLQTTSREFAKVYNGVHHRKELSCAVRDAIRKQLMRVIFESDRMTWTAIEPAFGGKIVRTPIDFRLRSPLYQANEITDRAAPVLIATRETIDSEDSLSPFEPFDPDCGLSSDWESRTYPRHPRQVDSVRKWLRSMIQRYRSSAEACSWIKTIVPPDPPSDYLLHSYEQDICDVRDAHRLVRLLAANRNWNDPPQEPQREYVRTAPWDNYEFLAEVADQLQKVLDWVNACTDVERTTPQEEAATASDPLVGDKDSYQHEDSLDENSEAIDYAGEEPDDGIGNGGVANTDTTSGEGAERVETWESTFSGKPEAAVRDFLDKCGVDSASELSLSKIYVRDLLVLRVRCGDDFDSIPDEPPATKDEVPEGWMKPAKIRDFIIEHFGEHVLVTSGNIPLDSIEAAKRIRNCYTDAGIKKLKKFRER